MPRDKGRRRVVAALRASQNLPTPLKTAAAITVALCIALAATGVTYATLNRSTTIALTTVSASNASLTVTGLTAAPAGTLYPGATSYQTASVTDTGGVPLALNIQSLTLSNTANAFSSSLSVSIGTVASAGNCTAGFTAAWTGTFASSPSGTSLGATVGTTSTVTSPSLTNANPQPPTAIICVAVTLPIAAPSTSQIASAPGFALVIGGTQAY